MYHVSPVSREKHVSLWELLKSCFLPGDSENLNRFLRTSLLDIFPKYFVNFSLSENIKLGRQMRGFHRTETSGADVPEIFFMSSFPPDSLYLHCRLNKVPWV